MDDIKISSNRSFGIVFCIVFLLIAIYPILKDGDLRIWSFLISIVFLILGIFTISNLNESSSASDVYKRQTYIINIL